MRGSGVPDNLRSLFEQDWRLHPYSLRTVFNNRHDKERFMVVPR